MIDAAASGIIVALAILAAIQAAGIVFLWKQKSKLTAAIKCMKEVLGVANPKDTRVADLGMALNEDHAIAAHVAGNAVDILARAAEVRRVERAYRLWGHWAAVRRAEMTGGAWIAETESPQANEYDEGKCLDNEVYHVESDDTPSVPLQRGEGIGRLGRLGVGEGAFFSPALLSEERTEAESDSWGGSHGNDRRDRERRQSLNGAATPRLRGPASHSPSEASDGAVLGARHGGAAVHGGFSQHRHFAVAARTEVPPEPPAANSRSQYSSHSDEHHQEPEARQFSYDPARASVLYKPTSPVAPPPKQLDTRPREPNADHSNTRRRCDTDDGTVAAASIRGESRAHLDSQDRGTSLSIPKLRLGAKPAPSPNSVYHPPPHVIDQTDINVGFEIKNSLLQVPQAMSASTAFVAATLSGSDALTQATMGGFLPFVGKGPMLNPSGPLLSSPTLIQPSPSIAPSLTPTTSISTMSKSAPLPASQSAYASNRNGSLLSSSKHVPFANLGPAKPQPQLSAPAKNMAGQPFELHATNHTNYKTDIQYETSTGFLAGRGLGRKTTEGLTA